MRPLIESSERVTEARTSASASDTVPKVLDSALDSKKSIKVATFIALAIFEDG